MDVLITGAAGIIGRRLVSRLVERGYGIIALIRETALDLNLPSARLLKGDLNNTEFCNDALAALCDLPGDNKAVIHLAGVGSATIAMRDPVLAVSDNVMLTTRILSASASHGVKRFVYVSTGMVYGRRGPEPILEAIAPVPESIYAASKLAAEVIVQGFTREFGMSSEIARLSNVFGPESPENTVVGRIIAQIRRGKNVEVMSPAPVRDFIFIDDVVEALCRLLSVTNEPGCVITNVSSCIGISIGELVAVALEISGRNHAKMAEVKTSNDCIVLSNKLMVERLGWRPSHSLSEGMKVSTKITT
jgi:nucleoside-diphosphate-sugar epimerase